MPLAVGSAHSTSVQTITRGHRRRSIINRIVELADGDHVGGLLYYSALYRRIISQDLVVEVPEDV